MRRYFVALLLTAFVACSFDWDSFDPRQGSSAAAGGSGGSGGSGSVTSSSASSSSTGGQGGAPDVCGDGTVGASEQCDDGNTAAGDGCDDSCMVECPGGILNPQTFHCYVIVDTAVSWTTAHDACLALGTGFDLVALSSQEEFDWFTTLPEFIAASQTDKIWMGGNDRTTEGTFEHTNGEPWPDIFWASGQPDDYMGSGGVPNGVGEDCVHMRDPAYNDLNCGAAENYACERAPAGR